MTFGSRDDDATVPSGRRYTLEDFSTTIRGSTAADKVENFAPEANALAN